MIKGFLISLLLIVPIFAESNKNTKEILNTTRSINKSVLKITRLFSKLTLAQKATVLKSLKALSADSDGDGVPNIVEPTGGICDSDLDDDGSSDGDEIKEGSNPKNPDSDDDGIKDGEDSSLSGTYGGKWLVVSDNCNIKSRFLSGSFVFGLEHKKETNSVELKGFAAPACLEEYNGTLNEGNLTAIRENSFRCPLSEAETSIVSSLKITGLTNTGFTSGKLVREARCGELECRIEYTAVGVKLSSERVCK